MNALTWIVTHPETATLAAYGVLNVLNAVIPPGRGWAGNAVHKARLVLDRLCLLQAGSRKLPVAKTRT